MSNATVQAVTVDADAFADDYADAYRLIIPSGCPRAEWSRVRDAARTGTEQGRTYLVTCGDRRYLTNIQTGWFHEDPAPGVARVISEA